MNRDRITIVVVDRQLIQLAFSLLMLGVSLGIGFLMILSVLIYKLAF